LRIILLDIGSEYYDYKVLREGYMMLDLARLPRYIDLSCVRTDNTMEELQEMVALAKDYRFCCAFAMPCYTKWVVEQLKEEQDIAVGGTVGFPSGADMTETKVETAKRFVQMGVDELDMVINVQALKNRDYEMVCDDIRRVREVADGRILKVILEVACLTDGEIQKGSELVARCGANFVKTGTGWMSAPSTVEHIRLIHDAIGDSIAIKAAGGVRTLNQIEQMIDAGCSRFGIGVRSTKRILQEAGL